MARVAPESLLLARAERWLSHVRGQVEAGDGTAGEACGGDAPEQLDRGDASGVEAFAERGGRLEAIARRHYLSSSSRTLGTTNAVPVRSGALASARSRSRGGCGAIVSERRRDGNRVDGRLDAARIERLEQLDVAEDRLEIAGHPFGLARCEIEARESGDPLDFREVHARHPCNVAPPIDPEPGARLSRIASRRRPMDSLLGHSPRTSLPRQMAESPQGSAPGTESAPAPAPAPSPSEVLAELPDGVLSGIRDLGWTSLMPVQTAVIPFMLASRDLFVQARTGSGKTGAFGIAIIATGS